MAPANELADELVVVVCAPFVDAFVVPYAGGEPPCTYFNAASSICIPYVAL